MLTPPSPRTAVIRARAPGSSGISPCQTATPERTLGFGARPSRACLAASNVDSTPGASASAIRSRSDSSRCTNRSIADATSSRLATRISLHSDGCEAARRVRSRNPPAASNSASASPASRSAAVPMSVVEATCGRWLTNATSRSCRSGSIATGRAPTASAHAKSVDAAAGAVSGAGAAAQTIPSRTDAEACSGPDRSPPPIGWPGTKRGRSAADAFARTSSITRVLTLATSVTIAVGAAARAATTPSGTAPIGVATTTTSARATASAADAAAVSPPPLAATASTSASTSHPPTTTPARRAARATDVPISPVPMTATRWTRGPSGDGIEVVPQPLGPVEVDVGDLAQTELGVEVEQDADDRGHRAGDRDLAGAQQRDVAETHTASRLCRERARQILGRGEQDADQVVVRDRVAFEQGLKELRRGGVQAPRFLGGNREPPPGARPAP